MLPAERTDRLHEPLRHPLDLFGVVGAPDAEAQRGPSDLLREAEGLEDVTRLAAPGRTRRARGKSHVRERDEQLLGVHARKRDVQVARQSALAGPVARDPVEGTRESLPERFAQRRQPSGLGFQIGEAQLYRAREAHDERYRQCTRAKSPLVAAPVHERLQHNPRPSLADVECADAPRPVELMGAHREQIDPPALHVHGDLADRLCGIGVQQNPALAADPTNLFDVLEGSDLTVRGHDRDGECAIRDRRLDRRGIDETLAVDGQDGPRKALTDQGAAGVEHRGVFDGARDQMIPASSVTPRETDEREIVALGGTTGEDDLRCVRRADRGREALAGDRHRLLGAPSKDVPRARGVAEILAPVGRHRVDDARVDGRGRVVVQVNRELQGHGGGPRQAANDSPQPQVVEALGLPILNPVSFRVSTKSSVVPIR